MEEKAAAGERRRLRRRKNQSIKPRSGEEKDTQNRGDIVSLCGSVARGPWSRPSRERKRRRWGQRRSRGGGGVARGGRLFDRPRFAPRLHLSRAPERPSGLRAPMLKLRERARAREKLLRASLSPAKRIGIREQARSRKWRERRRRASAIGGRPPPPSLLDRRERKGARSLDVLPFADHHDPLTVTVVADSRHGG